MNPTSEFLPERGFAEFTQIDQKCRIKFKSYEAKNIAPKDNYNF